jgi:hypothetical protein
MSSQLKSNVTKPSSLVNAKAKTEIDLQSIEIELINDVEGTRAKQYAAMIRTQRSRYRQIKATSASGLEDLKLIDKTLASLETYVLTYKERAEKREGQTSET